MLKSTTKKAPNTAEEYNGPKTLKKGCFMEEKHFIIVF